MDFEQIVLASKERQQFPLRDLVEFDADQGNLEKTVFYSPEENQLYVGKVFRFPIYLFRALYFFMAFIC